MIRKFASRFDFVPGSWKEGLAMLAPFLLFGICMNILYRVIGYLFASGWLQHGVNMIFFMVVIWLLPFVILGFDFVKGPPRWFLPYIGLLLPIFNLQIYESWIVPNWNGVPALYELTGNFPSLSRLNGFLENIIYQGTYWIGLFALLITVVMIIRVVPSFRSFHQKFREDWTLLSYIAYGTVPFVVILSFGDYSMDFARQGPYLFLVFLIFAAGGWFYLRANTPLKKILPLFVAMSLSLFIAEVSRGILYEFPRGVQLTWQARFLQLPWQTKLMGSIVIWIWVALFLVTPVLVKWLPGKGDPSQASLQEG